MIDIVFPKGNEEDFIETALKLGHDGLCFVYYYDKNTDKYEKRSKELQKKFNLKVDYGFIASPRDFNRIKKTEKPVFFESSDKNRLVVEKKEKVVLFSLENQNKGDFIHHRASGLNQVFCELASKNKIIVGFSFNLLLKNKKRLHVILGRMMQNIGLCRKYKIKTLIGSFAERPQDMRGDIDIISLFKILGMDEKK